MTGPRPDAVVVGAGVIGLTTAICLAEAGLRVAVVAARPPAETTSAVAGAVWGPHLVEDSPRVTRWGELTLAVLREQARDPAAGVRVGAGVQAAREAAALPAPPPWTALLDGVRPAHPDELPAGFAAGWHYRSPLVHMPTYLGYLADRLASAGGSVRQATAAALPGAARDTGAPLVLNCTGAAARELAGDMTVTPVRGQAVVVANPGLEEFFIGLASGGAGLVYVFPHGDVAVLGGTTVPLSGGSAGADLVPDPVVAERILRDCAAAVPALRGARVLAHRVGLRPFRPQVRLEAGPATPGGPLVVHNYGHGGAGVTLAWGCARDAAALAARLLG